MIPATVPSFTSAFCLALRGRHISSLVETHFCSTLFYIFATTRHLLLVKNRLVSTFYPHLLVNFTIPLPREVLSATKITAPMVDFVNLLLYQLKTVAAKRLIRL